MYPPGQHIAPESFPYLLDEIVAGLEQHFPPEIGFTVAPDGYPRVISVCGKQGAGQFLNLLKFLKADVLTKMTSSIVGVSPQDIDFFLAMARRHLRRIRTSSIAFSARRESFEPSSSVSWRPDKIRCVCSGIRETDPCKISDLLLQTNRHARLAFIVLQELEERISYFSVASFCSFNSLNQGSGPLPGTKFRLTCSVQYLGALIRVFTDRQLLENPNVTDLCRRIAAGVSTVRAEAISPYSLKNAVHAPDPQALEQLQRDLKIMVRCVEKMMTRG